MEIHRVQAYRGVPGSSNGAGIVVLSEMNYMIATVRNLPDNLRATVKAEIQQRRWSLFAVRPL
jgi:hypothetical protein